MENYPPYKITDKMLEYVSKIMEKVGEINSYTNLNKMPELRKQNRINSIHSSLASENNKLSDKYELSNDNYLISVTYSGNIVDKKITINKEG